MRLALRGVGCAALSFAACTAAHAQAPNQVPPEAPLKQFGTSQPLRGQYIVTLRPLAANTVGAVSALANQLVQPLGGQVLQVYGNSLRGFAARLSDAALLALRNNPLVESIENDATVSINEAALSPPAMQTGATWGLDRVDQRRPPLDGQYRYSYLGSSVFSFVIDTGIHPSHTEFAGSGGSRVMPGFTAINDGRGFADCNGHGTHVAGTVGGRTYGVAKSTWLVPVRVLDCNGSGSLSGVIAGIDWVAGQTALRPAVANLSLGSSRSSAVNQAVAGLVSKGVTVVVAGGNSNADACNYSPSSEASAISVGATTSSDARASYSNHGRCLDLFAPGSNIMSAWHTSDTATRALSGTSMAAPHVAGTAAMVLAARPSATPSEVARTLTGAATPGVVSSAGNGSPNRLLFSADTSTVPAGPAMAVRSLSGRSIHTALSWRAQATVVVQVVTPTGFGVPVAGATVQGTFSPGGSGSCVTSSAGSCSLSSASILRITPSSTFTVTGVDADNADYDAGRNAATTLVIQR